MLLEHEPDELPAGPLVAPPRGDVDAVEEDASFGGAVQAADQVQEGALARPGSARDRDELAREHAQAHVAQRLDRAEHRPAMLSGGERQRVAVARALANSPRLLLADEPTGALDSANSERIVELLVTLRERRGMTVVIVSYDNTVYAHADRTMTILDGRLDGDGTPR